VLVERFAGAGYGDLKKEVAEAYVSFAEPFADTVHELLSDGGALDDVLAEGARRARESAAPVLALAYERVGFVPATAADAGRG
jgi:tryptophanyl-tRNA synthetase